MTQTLFRGGLVYDGSGAAGRTLDLLIDGDTVAQVAPQIALAPGVAQVVDCTGLAVAPGFIDIHSHSDTACLQYPLAESRVMGGVTTEICGNCGGSAFPLDEPLRRHAQHNLEDQSLTIDWLTPADYFGRTAAVGCSVNRGYLVGHGNLRAMTVGFDAKPASPTDLSRMAALLEESLQAGALGLSSGLVYPPGCYSSTEEVCHLSKIVGRYDAVYASHIRSESHKLLEAVDEFLTIAKAGHCRALLSHVKTLNCHNWHKIDRLIAMLEEARAGGLRLYCDRYPYLATWTGLDSILFPAWVHDGGTEAELERLRDPALHAKLFASFRSTHPEDDWADRVMVVSCCSEANRPFMGSTLAQLGQHRGQEPFRAAIDLIIEEETRASGVYFGMSDENLQRLYRLPYVSAASDASIRNLSGAGDMSHPRTFGTTARFLGEYVRDKALMSWGEGIRRLTGLPAEIFGWQRRGRLSANSAADVVVFSREEIADRSTYANPAVAPAGIHHVMVNGQFVVRHAKHTGTKPGQIIKRGGRD